MMKNATRKQARAVTRVFWDINLCPVPSGFSPRRVRPCIKRFLEKYGYYGPLTIIAAGVLTDVPVNILREVFSSGISLTNVPYGSSDTAELVFTFTYEDPALANIMVISDPNFFPDISGYLQLMGHNLLHPCPYDSLQSLLQKDSGRREEKTETGVSACWNCWLCCRDPPGHDFENFATHLYDEEHQQLMLDLPPNDNDVTRPVYFHRTLMAWDWLPLTRAKRSEALTLVFWDINTCPVPPSCDARLVGPHIKRFLEKKVYLGSLTIIAVGLLTDLPIDILRRVYSSGIFLTNVPYGSQTDSTDTDRLISEFIAMYPHPANIMVISDSKVHSSYQSYLEKMGYNLLQYDSLERLLPADSGGLKEYKCCETGESAYWFCSLCQSGVANKGFDNFTMHISSGQHQQELLDLDLLPTPPSKGPEKNLEAVTSVFWDINRCPVPTGFDPRLVGPSIKRFLKNSGYSGPLTITAAGVLQDVPNDILRGVYAGGISLDNSEVIYRPSNIEDSVLRYTFSNPPPANIMVISDPEVFPSIAHYLEFKGYSFLSESSIHHLTDSAGALEEDNKCSETGTESASWMCSVCCEDVEEKGFEEFITHLSSRAHQRKMLDFLPINARFSREEDASYHGGESSKGNVNKNKNKRKRKNYKNY